MTPPYRDEVQRLAKWCKNNNLSLNIQKPRRQSLTSADKNLATSLHIDGDWVKNVPSFKFLGIHIAVDLTWSTITSTLVKKGQHQVNFLRILKENNLVERLLESFY